MYVETISGSPFPVGARTFPSSVYGNSEGEFFLTQDAPPYSPSYDAIVVQVRFSSPVAVTPPFPSGSYPYNLADYDGGYDYVDTMVQDQSGDPICTAASGHIDIFDMQFVTEPGDTQAPFVLSALVAFDVTDCEWNGKSQQYRGCIRYTGSP